jgi:hypothetical protein
MENLNTVKTLIERGDYMTVIDLKDAYFHILIHSDFQNYLRFRWRGKCFRYSALPFGITTAPRVFTKLLKTIMTVLRMRGIRIVAYIDDLLILAKTKEEARAHTKEVLELLIALGWTINWKKSRLEPSQTQDFLGMTIESHNMLFKVPRDMKKGIRKELESISTNKEIKLRDLARLLGKLNFIETAILPTRMMTWGMLRCKNSQLTNGWGGQIKLTGEAKEEIVWWKGNMKEWNG